jgi:hypothetical protein
MMDEPRRGRRREMVVSFQPRRDVPARPVADVRDECLNGAQCLFDPELHDGPGRVESAEERAARVEVAKQVCASCPVADACLIYVLFTRPSTGVWAGYTADELAAAFDDAATFDDSAPAPVGEVA